MSGLTPSEGEPHLQTAATPDTVTTMPSDQFFKAMNVLHRSTLKLTAGRLGLTAGKMPVLELTTVGRVSGQKRSVMLTSPFQDGGSILIVASKGGSDTHPAWFLNLRDNSAVDVAWKGASPVPMAARIISPDERRELWPKVTSAYSGYARYQERTEREIPLIMLEVSE